MHGSEGLFEEREREELEREIEGQMEGVRRYVDTLMAWVCPGGVVRLFERVRVKDLPPVCECGRETDRADEEGQGEW